MATEATSTARQWISLSIIIFILSFSRTATLLTIRPKIMSQTTKPKDGYSRPKANWNLKHTRINYPQAYMKYVIIKAWNSFKA